MTLTPLRPEAKRTRWRPLLGLGLLIVAQYGSARAESAMSSLLKPLDLVGYSARTTPPPLGGETIDARTISMTSLRGKVVVVNFWATWCRECRQEMPALERLHREFATQGLAIVGINVREEGGTVRHYANELGLTFPLMLDPGGKVSARYGVVGLPATFLVGRDGRAVGFATGPREWESAPGRALFNALLAEPVGHSDRQ